MRCDLAREALSAQLDGELTPLEEEGLAAHVKGCVSCQSYARDLDSLHRTVRLRQASPVPDLTRAIVATAGPRLPSPRRTSTPWPSPGSSPWPSPGPSPSPRTVLRTRRARAALFCVAVFQFAMALPELVIHTHAGHDAHMTRELGAFGVALAIGMLVVAWQPQRASGMLPMTFALTTAVTVTAVADVVLGHSGPSGQAPHFLELIGLVLLWYLARVSRPAPDSPLPPRSVRRPLPI